MMMTKEAWKQKELFVHKLRAGKPGKAIWEIQEYCRSEKKYLLIDTADISNSCYLSGSKPVAIAEY